MAKTIWFVSTGSYSDYRVRAIFSDKEQAIEYMKELKQANSYEEPFLEEREMDVPREELDGAWCVVINQEGEVLETSFDTYPTPNMPPRRWKERSVWICYSDPNNHRYERFLVNQFEGFGLTPEHARRSAEELRRQTIAVEGKLKTQDAEMKAAQEKEDEARNKAYARF